jgi:ABC-type multidrug transport system fused ATPase/permease subunit
LANQFNALSVDGPLWKKLLRLFWPRILLFCILIFLQSLFGVTAPAFLHRLLLNLEGRAEADSTVSAGVWLTVFGYGFSLVLQAYADGWVQWVTTSELDTHIQGLLSTLVFRKSVQRLSGSALDQKRDANEAAKPQTAVSVINLLKTDRFVEKSTSP